MIEQISESFSKEESGVFDKEFTIEILKILYKSELKLEKEIKRIGNDVFFNLKNILPSRSNLVDEIAKARTTIHDNIVSMNRSMTYYNGGEKIVIKIACNQISKRGRPPVYYRINMKAFESLPEYVKDKVLESN